MVTTNNLNLEDEIARLETELRLYKQLKLTSIERRINELLDALDDPAAPQTKGQRLRERLSIAAVTVALLSITQTKFELPLVFQQGTKQEQVAPKFSSSSAPSLGTVGSTPSKLAPKLEAKPQVNSTPGLATSSTPSLGGVDSTSPKSTPKLSRLMTAIATQESGGNHTLINSDSGATGKWQVMPNNIPEWSRAALGREVSRSEFLLSPQLQRKIVRHRLSLYLDKQSLPGRSEEEIIRRVASAWYSGRPSLWNNTNPQGKYPSIAAYTKSVWHLYQQAGSPSPLDKTRQIISTWPQEFQEDPKAGDMIAGYPVTSPRGMRISPTAGVPKFHQGVDIGTPIGTPIRAIADGYLQCEWWSDAGIVGLFTSEQFPGLRFDLLHLSKCVGDQGSRVPVRAGEIIGWTGTAGTGPHLHLAIKSESGKFLRVRSGWLYWFVSGKNPSQK